MSIPSSKSRTIFHKKINGAPFGVYYWTRNNTEGVVARVGPLGHVQLQCYRMRIVGHGAARRRNRRGKHGIAVYVWGVRGRRRKLGFEIAVTL